MGTATYKNGISADADLWQMPFRDGIAEDYLSTRWFVSRYEELAGEAVKDAKAISALYETVDNAKKVFHEFGTTLGEFIIQLVDLNQPEAIVLGGNICRGLSFFEPQVKEVLQKKGINLPVITAMLSEYAPIIGACS